MIWGISPAVNVAWCQLWSWVFCQSLNLRATLVRAVAHAHNTQVKDGAERRTNPAAVFGRFGESLGTKMWQVCLPQPNKRHDVGNGETCSPCRWEGNRKWQLREPRTPADDGREGLTAMPSSNNTSSSSFRIKLISEMNTTVENLRILSIFFPILLASFLLRDPSLSIRILSSPSFPQVNG